MNIIWANAAGLIQYTHVQLNDMNANIYLELVDFVEQNGGFPVGMSPKYYLVYAFALMQKQQGNGFEGYDAVAFDYPAPSLPEPYGNALRWNFKTKSIDIDIEAARLEFVAHFKELLAVKLDKLSRALSLAVVVKDADQITALETHIRALDKIDPAALVAKATTIEEVITAMPQEVF